MLTRETDEAAGEKQPEVYFIPPAHPQAAKTACFPCEHIENCFDPRTKLDARFSMVSTCIHLFAVVPSLALRLALVLTVRPRSCGEVLR